MKVSDILDHKGTRVFTIKPSDTIATLSRSLQQHRVGALVVSSNGATIDGIISERDIACSLAGRRGELHLLSVSALMTRNVVTCSPEDELSAVSEVMSKRHIRHLPVTVDGRLSGLISMRDVLEFQVEAMKRRSTMIRNLIIATE